MRSFTGVDIVFRLLNGALNGTDLETALTTDAPKYLGPFIEILKSVELNALFNSSVALNSIFSSAAATQAMLDNAGEILAASDDITEIISNNSSAIKTVVTNSTYLDLWYATSANFSRLLARINASGSKLIGESFTSSGTWTNPGGLIAFAYYCNGHGGAGGNAQNNGGHYYGGSGGSGGESVFGQITDPNLCPVGNLTITIPTSIASPTTIDAIASAAAGLNGETLGSARTETTGGGTTSGDAIYPIGFANGATGHIWIPTTGRKQGGAGGRAALSPGFTSDYTNGGSGVRGLANGGIATGTVNVNRHASGGPFESDGGCGGLYDTSGGNNGLADPGAGFGAGGGGGTNSNGTPYNGAAGVKGVARVWAVIE